MVDIHPSGETISLSSRLGPRDVLRVLTTDLAAIMWDLMFTLSFLRIMSLVSEEGLEGLDLWDILRSHGGLNHGLQVVNTAFVAAVAQATCSSSITREK